MRILLLFVLGGGVFAAACTPQEEKVKSEVNLNTAKMVEADDDIIDPTMGPALISAYLYRIQSNLSNDSIPCADVYVCKSFKRDSVLGDTVIILDTHLRTKILGNPDIYWTGFKKQKPESL